jgi:hypothetical protein
MNSSVWRPFRFRLQPVAVRVLGRLLLLTKALDLSELARVQRVHSAATGDATSAMIAGCGHFRGMWATAKSAVVRGLSR